MDSTVCDGGEPLVVGDDDEGLAKLVTQIEEELMEFLFILGVE